ncbi:type III-A CRISPR-associated RAMP protein Csm4 [Catalinimonas sp. 4WD22]|uniref:type III-A CRISPR-associated RAMP protein Csm4 n=1 Tax=Catalinimonas locisalis TaxID=3133978 RepID=UPI003101348B
MPKIEILKLAFSTPLHIGSVRADYATSSAMLHSDTLYSAVMQAWSMLGKEEWIPQKGQWKDLGFTLSSLFPYTTLDNQAVYFFPKPYGFLNDQRLKDEQKPESKANKKVQFYDSDYFFKFLKNEPVGPQYAKHVQGSFLSSKSIDAGFMQKQVYPRVKVARSEGEDAIPYYVERLYFKKGSGLFTIVSYENEEARKRLRSALNLLQDEGLGTDRHVGHGLFKLEEDTGFKLEEQLPLNTNHMLNLSLYCPETKGSLEEMIQDENARYELVQRGGWITTYPHMNLRKKTVHMFKEGSVFRKPSAGLTAMGSTQDLAPDKESLPEATQPPQHPIWRCGKSLFIPVNVNAHA